MNRAEVIDFLGNDWKRCCTRMTDALSSDIELLNQTNGSILEHGGKKLRPMLSLLVAKALSPADGPLSEDSIRYATAVELLHNATLLHDDVADCSDTRRGRPTVMSLLGSSAAVLVGDFWLVRAVDEVLSAEGHKLEVIALFSKTLSDLAEGEMFQLQKAGSDDTTEEDYLRIIYCKTASLFVTACVSAAKSVNASPQEEEMVRSYAKALGMAFQIKDDILDYVGGNLGKPVGQDLKEQKITMPLLGALSSADAQTEQKVRSWVRGAAENEENCSRVLEFVAQRGGLEYARMRLDEYVAQAVSALAPLKPSQAREYLMALAEYSASRNK